MSRRKNRLEIDFSYGVMHTLGSARDTLQPAEASYISRQNCLVASTGVVT